MEHSVELDFVKELLKASHIDSYEINTKVSLATEVEQGLHKLFMSDNFAKKSFSEFFPDIESNTLYKISDRFYCRYIFFLYPHKEDTAVVFGPYVLKEITHNEVIEIAEELGLGVQDENNLEYFYQSVPYIRDENHIISIMSVLAQRLWGNDFSFEDISRESSEIFSPSAQQDGSEDEKSLWNMHIMEERYKQEKELTDAIVQGQSHKAKTIFTRFSSLMFEKRTADPLRNIKNYCIITNTLFRKAAQEGGVHPIYLDSISSEYARKIEQLPRVEDSQALFIEMFEKYCYLVRNHNTQKYSPLIQKVIILVDSDLTAPLNLNEIAKKCSISPGYLSNLFRNETGETLTDFVTRRRIKQAKKLLRTTNLQIQTVAQHCGIFDVHYFTKLFKKYEEMTPRQYREKSLKKKEM
jgi:AraC-like DNA-binding protein